MIETTPPRLSRSRPLSATGLENSALRTQLRRDIAQARKLDPAMAEAFLAEGWIQSPRPIIGWLRFSDEAVAKNPYHGDALATRSLGLLHVGRMHEAVNDAQLAVQVEPLSPSARQALVHALMDSGSIEAARRELEEAERLWPGASNLTISRGTLEFRFGDPRVALKILQSGARGGGPSPAQLSIAEARINPTPQNIQRAVDEARSDYVSKRRSIFIYAQTLAQFGRKQELIDLLLSVHPASAPSFILAMFRPEYADLRRDPTFMEIAGRFGLVEFWSATGRWPDFCFAPGPPYDCKAEAATFRAN